MTKRKGIRLLAALALCFTLCFSFTVPAFAYADDTEQELPVTEATQPEETPEPAPAEEPEPYEGEPIDDEGKSRPSRQRSMRLPMPSFMQLPRVKR